MRTRVRNSSFVQRVSFVTVRTGRTAEGHRVREERNTDGTGQRVWNAYEGRVATQEEIDSTTWR
jgi:hypothetical protein